jgi:hypothetical protein
LWPAPTTTASHLREASSRTGSVGSSFPRVSRVARFPRGVIAMIADIRLRKKIGPLGHAGVPIAG